MWDAFGQTTAPAVPTPGGFASPACSKMIPTVRTSSTSLRCGTFAGQVVYSLFYTSIHGAAFDPLPILRSSMVTALSAPPEAQVCDALVAPDGSLDWAAARKVRLRRLERRRRLYHPWSPRRARDRPVGLGDAPVWRR